MENVFFHGEERIKKKFNNMDLKAKINNLFWGLKRQFYTDANFYGVYFFLTVNYPSFFSPYKLHLFWVTRQDGIIPSNIL